MKPSIFLKVTVISFFFQLFLVVIAHSQEITVQGQVKDIFNRIIMGASIKLQGTNTEVYTDSMGYYQITVPVKGKLIFSQDGFVTQKIAVKGKTTIDIAFNLDLNRDSQIVTSSSVDKKMLNQNREANISQLLQTVPGIQIVNDGSEIKLLIRGQRSLTGNNYALVVLNGTPYNGSLYEIDRNDIQSIEVLKDAASMTSWGSRGANGVVLISTKAKKEQ
ncbi:MAG TPA: TonB-dependent receptor plug domain-containing protein [Paludibacter sp.]|nr:TonB-dependent receptor plug domain-containing protein [Paludibacter sp.]